MLEINATFFFKSIGEARMREQNVVILLFASDKLVCTGAVNEKMVYDAVEKLMAELIQKRIVGKIIVAFS
ncbi:MAG: hypothetical protein QXN53_04085 [Thermoproteota archaeon]